MVTGLVLANQWPPAQQWAAHVNVRADSDKRPLGDVGSLIGL